MEQNNMLERIKQFFVEHGIEDVDEYMRSAPEDWPLLIEITRNMSNTTDKEVISEGVKELIHRDRFYRKHYDFEDYVSLYKDLVGMMNTQ